MLLDINIRATLKVAWRGIGVLVLGTFGIVIGAAVAFYLAQKRFARECLVGVWRLAGSWIGGTGNLAAVAESLDTPGEMVGFVVLVDNFVYVLYFPVILSCKRWAKQFNKFTGVSEEQIAQIAKSVAEVEKKTHEVHFSDLLTLLGWGFSAILAANLIAKVLPGSTTGLDRKDLGDALGDNLRNHPFFDPSEEDSRLRAAGDDICLHLDDDDWGVC